MRGRLDVVEVERGDPVDVLEDPGELAGHPVDLVVGQLEPRQAGDVQDLLAIDHGLHVRLPLAMTAATANGSAAAARPPSDEPSSAPCARSPRRWRRPAATLPAAAGPEARPTRSTPWPSSSRLLRAMPRRSLIGLRLLLRGFEWITLPPPLLRG